MEEESEETSEVEEELNATLLNRKRPQKKAVHLSSVWKELHV